MGKELDSVLQGLNKAYGANSIGKMKDMEPIDVELFSSQSIALDIALGGGYPKGRIIEIYGPESSGKTTLCLHAIAECQEKGEEVAFIDAEHALDPNYAESLGVNMDELIFNQPDYGEQALEIVHALLKSNEVGLIVVDSVAALVPKAELEGEMGDQAVGKQAKLMAQAMRKLVSAAKQSSCTVIFINQLRDKIGVMFGSPETTTGGKALKFAASQRIDIRRTGSIKDGEDIVANKVKIKVVKNKVAPPFKIAQTAIIFGEGLSKETELLEYAVDLGIVEKKGSWFSYSDEKLGQGASSVVNLLKDNPELTQELEEAVKVLLKQK